MPENFDQRCESEDSIEIGSREVIGKPAHASGKPCVEIRESIAVMKN
jgi:hypothetical protein